MSSYTENFIECILSRLDSGPLLDEGELNRSIETMERKLKILEQQEEEHSNEINAYLDEVEDINHPYYCNYDSSALHCFLNNVLQATEKMPGCENFVLEDLVMFCNQNSIVLPSETTQNHYDGSLNSLNDEEEEATIQLWANIKTKLKNGVVSLLRDIPSCNIDASKCASTSVLNMEFNQQRKLHLLTLLFCIYPNDEVFEICFQLRQWQIATKCPAFPVTFEADDESVKLRAVELLHQVVEESIEMLKEDFQILECLSQHQFEDEGAHHQNLLNLYSDNISTFVKKIIQTHTNVYENSIGKNIERKFSAADVRNFANVFYILNYWSASVVELLKPISRNTQTDHASGERRSGRTSKVKISSLIRDYSEKNTSTSIWNWKEEFESVSKLLLKVIPSYIQCIVKIITESAGLCTLDESVMKTVSVSEQLIRCGLKYPLKVSYNAGYFLSLLCEIINFAKEDESTATLNELREETITSLLDGLQEYLQNLQKKLLDLKKMKVCVDDVYTAICDMSFICNQCNDWADFAGWKRDSKHLFVQKSLKELRDQYIELLITFHLNVIKSSLVYDAHSNNWKDDKSFFEGERCSFPIQMVSFYIRGIVSDMSKQLCPAMTQYILKGICKEMLTFFMLRYICVKPSYRRIKQFRGDILVLLQTYRYIMLCLSSNEIEFLDLESETFKEWHALCNVLLETLVIVAAPIEHVQKYFETRAKSNSSKTKIIWYKEIDTKVDRMNEQLTLFTIIVNQPLVDWNLLIKLLISRSTELPILIANHNEYLKEEIYENDHVLDTKLNQMFFIPQHPKLKKFDIMKFHESMYHILIQTSSASFVYYMATIMEADNSKSFKEADIQQLPVWMQLIAKDLSPYFKKIFEPILEMFYKEENFQTAPSFKFTELERLPCGCQAIKKSCKKKSFQLLHTCLMEMLSMLTDTLTTIPTPIWDVLAYIKEQERFTASWIEKPHLGTKILACLLYNWLSTAENVSLRKDGIKFSPDTQESIKSFAELVWHVVFHLTHDVTDNPKILMHLFKDLQQTSVEVKEKLLQLDKYCNRSTYKIRDSSAENLSLFLSKNEEGIAHLKHVEGILKLNRKTIQLLMAGVEDADLLRRSCESIQGQSNAFYPLEEFQRLNDEKLNHAELMEAELNWCDFIPIIPEDKWRNLVENRFEFQEANVSILTDPEKEAVQSIREKLFGFEIVDSTK